MNITLIVLFTGITVVLLTICVLYPMLTRHTVLQQRLDELTQKRPERIAIVTEKTSWQEFLEKLGDIININKKEKSKYAQMLVAAGYKRPSVSLFIGVKVLLACILPMLFIVLFALPQGQVLQFNNLLYVAALAISGFLLPSFWLYRKVDFRKTQIFHTLPDVLDLLTICVEAGLGLDAALIRVSDNPIFKGNPLAEEMKTASLEVRAGKSRKEALTDMANRTMVDDVHSFVVMLIQTERFGTSLSLSLRVHSESLRTKRRQIAEEAAAKTSIKILFPLAFFIFPALLLVIIGPAFFKIAKIFS
jgi:tight adherence protein C